jgi:hypothetical protein
MSQIKAIQTDIHSDFLTLLKKLEGLPADQQPELKKIIRLLHKRVITRKQADLVAALIAGLFCSPDMPNFSMTARNRKLVREYSDKHLDQKKHKLEHSAHPAKRRKTT